MFRLCGPGGRRLPGVAEGIQSGQHRAQGPRSEAGGVLRTTGKGKTHLLVLGSDVCLCCSDLNIVCGNL